MCGRPPILHFLTNRDCPPLPLSLVIAAGLSAKSVDIVFLGSGPYQFAPLPFKYVRPAAAADEATAVEAEASSGTSNGTLIGEPDSGGCWSCC